jgi:hypothetical protein
MKFRLTTPRSPFALPVQLQGKSLLVSLEMSDTAIRMVIIEKLHYLFSLYFMLNFLKYKLTTISGRLISSIPLRRENNETNNFYIMRIFSFSNLC